MGSSRIRAEKIEKFFVSIVQDQLPDEYNTRSVRVLLWCLQRMSRLYRFGVQSRLFLYKNRIFRPHTLGCQVISVGNLTVGGTGKTPVVEVFARRLKEEGRKVAILSRGYKKREPALLTRIADTLLARDKKRPPRIVSDGHTLLLDSRMGGDEPYMLASHLPEVVVLVDKDRVKSGRCAVSKYGCDTLILDDGFQYMDLKHRLDIVLVDRRNPFGNGEMLPCGPLREPVCNIARADVILITKCDGSSNEELKARLRALNDHAEMIECAHAARYLQNVFTGEREELSLLWGSKVIAMSGIAAPGGFEEELVARGAKIVERARFADHHRYSQQELIDTINRGLELSVNCIVTTEKDAVRFPFVERRDVPVYFLRVDIKLLSGTEDFDECISRICFRKNGSKE